MCLTWIWTVEDHWLLWQNQNKRKLSKPKNTKEIPPGRPLFLINISELTVNSMQGSRYNKGPLVEGPQDSDSGVNISPRKVWFIQAMTRFQTPLSDEEVRRVNRPFRTTNHNTILHKINFVPILPMFSKMSYRPHTMSGTTLRVQDYLLHSGGS